LIFGATVKKQHGLVTAALMITSTANAKFVTPSSSYRADAALKAEKDKACSDLMEKYKHHGATATEMREYAWCVKRLHPEPMAEGYIIAGYIAALVIFVSIVACVISEKRNRLYSDDWFGALVCGGFVGAGFGIMVVCLAAIVFFLIRHLLP
jgi:hypothetical protein